ncbi:MAG: PASTA domain-containing protein [Actinomycetota bacterium]
MTIAAERTTIELGTAKPAQVVITNDTGSPIDPDSCAPLGDTPQLIEAATVAAGSAPNEIVVTFDLRRSKNPPEPGSYQMVIRVPDLSNPDPVQLVPLTIEIPSDKSCLALTGIRPGLTVDTSGAVTLKLSLYNRCGHSVSFDLRIICDNDTLAFEPGLSIGAELTRNVEVGISANDAIEDLRLGRIPDDLAIAIGKSNDAGSIDLELTPKDLLFEDHRSPGQGDRPRRPEPDPVDWAPPSRPPPPPKPRPSWAGRVSLWLVAAAAVTVISIILIDLASDDDDEEGVHNGSGDPAEPAGSSSDASDTGQGGGSDGSGSDSGKSDSVVIVGRYTGLTESQAKEMASQDDLVPSVVDIPTDNQDDDGIVLRQEPNAEIEVAPGTAIELSVGRFAASPSLIVGSYIGEKFDDAETVVSASGLIPIREDVDVNDPALDGTIINQSPAAGTEVDQNSTVTLDVGQFDESVIPDLTGVEDWRAGEILNELQRAVGETQPGYRDELTCDPPGGGVVATQDPAAGTLITGPFEATIVISVTCEPVPDLFDPTPLTVTEAVSVGRAWLGEGRRFGIGADCPDRDTAAADTQLVARTEPVAGVNAAKFTIFCTPILG